MLGSLQSPGAPGAVPFFGQKLGHSQDYPAATITPVSYLPISLDDALERLAQGHAVYVDCPSCEDQHCYTSLEAFAQAIVEHGLQWKLSTLRFYVRELT